MARTSVSDPTPRSTPPAPPPDPERVRGGHGCGSSLTEAWRPLERGAEALEGVGVPELMEGAGPTPGTKTPRLPGGWGLRGGAQGSRNQAPVPLEDPGMKAEGVVGVRRLLPGPLPSPPGRTRGRSRS